jgi:WD40 repeat protein
VLSIAYQLSSQIPDYQTRLNALGLEKLILEANAQTLFDTLIVQLLSGNFPKPNRIIVVLIDALDEATEDGKNELATFIASEFSKIPEWIRLVITSRPEPEVMHPLQGFTPYVLDTEASDNLNDIRDYLVRELKPFVEEADARSAATDAILARSEGLFLYAECVRQELAEGRLSLKRLHEFPQGLGGVYAQFFKRQIPNLNLYKVTVRPVLEVVTAAQEPLDLKLIGSIFDWGEYKMPELRQLLGSLFPIIEGRMQSFHHSVTDWLTDADRAGSYFVSVREGHKRLAEYGWREYERAGMSCYVVAHLPTHLARVENWSALERLLTDIGYIEASCGAGIIYSLPGHLQAAIERRGDQSAASMRSWLAFLRQEAHRLEEQQRHGYNALLQQAANQTDFADIRAAGLQVLQAKRKPWLQLKNPTTDASLFAVPCDETGVFLANLRFSLGDVQNWSQRFGKTIWKWLESQRWYAQSNYRGNLLNPRALAPAASDDFVVLSEGSYGIPMTFDITTGETSKVVDDSQLSFPDLHCVSMSPDGLYTACGAKNGWMQILYQGEHYWSHQLPPKTPGGADWDVPWIYSCAFSDDGQWCAFADGQERCHIVEVASRTMYTVQIGTQPCYGSSIVWRPGGQQLVFANHELGSNPKLVNWRLGEVLDIPYTPNTKGHGRISYTLAFDRAGELLAVAGGHYVGIWDADSGELVERIDRPANRCVFLEDDQHLALWSRETKAITVFPKPDVSAAATPAPRPPLRHESAVQVVGTWPESSLLFSSSNSAITVTDLNTMAETKMPMASGVVQHITWRDAELMVAGVAFGYFTVGELRFFNRELRTVRQAYSLPKYHTVDALATRPSDRAIASASSHDGTVRIWRLTQESLTEDYRLFGYLGSGRTVRQLTFAPDGSSVALSISTTVIIWALESLEVIFSRPDAGGCVHFFSGRPWLLTGNGEYASGSYELYDLITSVRTPLRLAHGWLTFSPDDAFVAVVDTNRVSIFSCKNFEILAQYMARNRITCVAWAGNGRLILGGADGSIEVLEGVNWPAIVSAAPIRLCYSDAIAKLNYRGQFEHKPFSYGPSQHKPDADIPYALTWANELSGSRWPADWNFECQRCGNRAGDPLRSCPYCGNS